jgi:polysaccharide biosynthesis/export protein
MRLLKMAAVILIVSVMSWPITALGNDYLIGEGDVLDVSVWGVRELSFSAKVRPDGKITVPGLGDVVATGQSPALLQEALEGRLKTLVKNPIVTVSVREITNNQLHIFGGGVASGVYDLSRRTTLLQLLCQISDFTRADLHGAYVLRGQEKIKTGFHRLFIEGDASEDLLLHSGDVIFIPVAKEMNVYVLGAVNTPKFIPFREGLTVMEAILEAGGFTKFARPNSTVILREINGREHRIGVRVRDLMKSGNLNQNIKLQVGDYVIVREGLF